MVDGHSRSHAHYSTAEDAKRLWRYSFCTAENRTMAAFWLLGLINNSGESCCSMVLEVPIQIINALNLLLIVFSAYVIMIAGANDISDGSVGLVYFCAIFPTLLVKLTCPYWWDSPHSIP